MRACGEAQELLQRDWRKKKKKKKRSEEEESREHFMEEKKSEQGPAGGKSWRMERKEISQVRSAGNKGRTGRKCR